MRPTLVTKALVVFGLVTNGTLVYIYIVFLRSPHSQKSKVLMIGKGKDWRDKTHFLLKPGFAWSDFLFFVPLIMSGSFVALLGQFWGYVLFGAVGGVQPLPKYHPVVHR